MSAAAGTEKEEKMSGNQMIFSFIFFLAIFIAVFILLYCG